MSDMRVIFSCLSPLPSLDSLLGLRVKQQEREKKREGGEEKRKEASRRVKETSHRREERKGNDRWSKGNIAKARNFIYFNFS